MIFFITVLRALAACLITNAHYTGVYPTDLIANGGLIGDVLFFAVSGYCLSNIKLSFPRWYAKRIYRVYTPVWIITAVFLLLGCFSLTDHSWWYYFIYPTDYHFVASIILLYIPFYLFMRIKWCKDHIPLIMLLLTCIALLVYVVFYDKTYYHIDTVREPFIRFLFMASMLLGAYFRKNDHRFRNHFSWIWIFLTVVCLGAYFASKMFFSDSNLFVEWQIINQGIIFVLLYCIFRLFVGLDNTLERLPKWMRKVISFVAEITLEIYVVQYVLIDVLRPLFDFPINWFIITTSIILGAVSLHWVCKGVYCLKDKLIYSIKNYKVK